MSSINKHGSFRAGVTAVAAAVVTGAAWPQVLLLTAEEARLPEGSHPMGRAITRGPGVQVLSPTDVVANAFALEVKFEPRGGTRIDLSTLKVEYLKSPTVDLTDRIRPHAREDGISAGSLRVPVGEHRLRVSVRDIEGRVGSALVDLRAR